MKLICKHAVIRTSDVQLSRTFYVETLNLELLENEENFFAVKAGDVRISVFGGADAPPAPADDFSGIGLIFATDDVVAVKAELEDKGVELAQDIVEAPGFMKFLTLLDPDRNVIYVGEYLTNDMMKKLV